MSDKALRAAAVAVADYTDQRLSPHPVVRTCEGIAQAAVQAYLATREAEGFVMVPVKPTKEMMRAGIRRHPPHGTYAAMLAARPKE